MSRFPFNPKQSLILCHVELVSRTVELSLKMAVDTGATYTMIPMEAAVALGCHPAHARRRIEITMGSGVEFVPIVIVPTLRAFGVAVTRLPVICHNLPTPSPVEGLLGLNFLTQAHLIIDFSANVIRS